MCGYGEIGIRTRFRFWRSNPCRFNSCYPHQKLSRRVIPTAFILVIDFKVYRARILEITVEFKCYVKAAVLVFVDVYLADKQAQIRI